VNAGQPVPVMDARVRAALLGIFLLGVIGTAVELLLLEHIEDPWQWVPLVLIGSSLIVLGWHGLARSRAAVRLFQGLMALFVAGGVAGLVLHYRANVEFEREMHPDGSAWELFQGAMMGATPALAPGTMMLLGLLGVVWSHRHPALGRASREESG
jgi:hypothetical protein